MAKRIGKHVNLDTNDWDWVYSPKDTGTGKKVFCQIPLLAEDEAIDDLVLVEKNGSHSLEIDETKKAERPLPTSF